MRSTVAFLLTLAFTCAPAAADTSTPGTPAPAEAAATPSGPKKGEPADEFTGYGKAPFGTTFDEFKKLYPTAEPIPEGQDLGSPTVGGPYIRRLLLVDQQVEGLPKPTKVELRFWKNKLWGVIVYYGDNDGEKIHAMLTKRLGTSDSTDAENPLWERAKTQTTAQMKQRWYGVNDIALSDQARAWFALMLTGQWKGASEAELVELGLATPRPTEAAASPSPAVAATPEQKP